MRHFRYSVELFRLRATFFSPNALNPEQQLHLLRNTIGQWEDGIGEGGFTCTILDRIYDVRFRQDESITVDQVSDSQLVPPPPFVAIAARDGNLRELASAIERGGDANQILQGYSALHLTILYGQENAAMFLLQHGAEVSLDKDGNSTLYLCIVSNSLNDQQSASIAAAILARMSPGGEDKTTLIETAKLRGKTRTVKLLGAALGT